MAEQENKAISSTPLTVDASPASTTPPPTTTTSPPPTATGTPTSHTVVTIIFLLFFPLIGIILMWVWTKWSKVPKWIITILFILGQILTLIILPPLILAILSTANPAAQIERAQNVKEAGSYEEYMNEQFTTEEFVPLDASEKLPASAEESIPSRDEMVGDEERMMDERF